MADGSIKISTKIGTEGFEKGKKRLEQGLDQLENSMNRLAKSTFGVDKAANRAFESARLKAQDTEIAIAEIEKKMEAIREASKSAGVESSKAFQKAKAKADELNRSLAEMYAQRDALAETAIQNAAPPGVNMSELPDSFIDKTISQDAGVKEIDKQIAKAEVQLAKYQAQMNGAKLSANGLTDEAERELKSLEKKLDGLNIRLLQYRKRMEEAKNGTHGISGAVNKAKKSFQGLFGESKRTERQMGNTAQMIKGMLLSMILFSSVMLIMKSITEGLQNMAQASGSANTVLSNLTTNFLYLKNSIASAVMPVLQALSPLIIFITDNLASLFSMIGMITSRIFGGATTFTKAKKAQTDYAASLDKTGKSAKKATDALAAFDEINVLQDNQRAASDATPGMPDPSAMFEEVAIPQNVISFADKIKGLFGGLKDTAQPTIDAFKHLGEAMKPLGEFGWTALKDFYKDFLKPVGEWTLGEGIPRLVDALANGLEKVNWDRINDGLDEIWKALAPFTIHVGEGLLWFWENVLVPLGTWTLNEVVPRFLNGLALVIQILDAAIQSAKPAFKWLWDEFLTPAAKWTGTFLLDDLDLVLGVLVLIAGLLKGDVKQSSDGAGKAFENLGNIIEDVFIFILGGKAVQAIEDFVSTWSETISSWWANDVAPWFTLDRWTALFDTIKLGFSGKWNEIQAWWSEAIGEWWKNQVTPWFTSAKWIEMMKGVKDGFVVTFRNAVNAAIDLFNRFIDWVNSKMTISWDGLKIKGKEIFPSGSMQLFTIPHIPQLATGAVIPPNAEFMAILGDQRNGRNLEAPEGLIRQIVREETADLGGGGETTIRFEGNMSQLIRVMKPYIDKENNRKGKNLVKGAPAW